MIRRQLGSDWLLITQDDHARLAGKLAARVGNAFFDRPEAVEDFVQAVANHDCGWPLHDDQPTLNGDGAPLDVFETPATIHLKLWAASSERAAAINDRVGLLVSLHSLALSTIVHPPGTPEKERANPSARFELNKFQHRQIELQELCRQRLGLGTDLPLNHGLALESDQRDERQIVFQFRLLQALDVLSLAICCTKPPVTQIKPVLARPGGREHAMRVRRPGDDLLTVSPWPFDIEEIRLEIPCRRLAARPFADEAEFRTAFAAAPPEPLGIVVSSRR
jgi:hypothetical protein